MKIAWREGLGTLAFFLMFCMIAYVIQDAIFVSHVSCPAGEKEFCHGCCSCYGVDAMYSYCSCIREDCVVVGPHELNCSGEQRWFG